VFFVWYSDDMKNIRWWAPVTAVVLALTFGFLPYVMFAYSGKIPVSLRDNPWPLEVLAIGATIAAIGLAVQAYRQKRVRIVATVSALLATMATALFLLLVHVGSYQLPVAPKELAVGMTAPDFVLPDAKGNSFALASTRGHRVLLVFYRGAW
jgi:AhpC/TSA family